MAEVQINKMSWWHKSIVDWELEHPDRKLGECALEMGVTESWLSTIRNSDIYREYEALRRIEHNENVSKSVIEQVDELAGTALGVLNERIKNERDKIGLGVVIDAGGMALKALGFGPKHGGRGGDGPQVVIQLGAASPELLERARGAMKQVNSPGGSYEQIGGLAKALPAPSSA